jgi:hypothetical protein
MDKRRRNKMKFCFKTKDAQWKDVGDCAKNPNGTFWPIGPLTLPFSNTYHLNDELKVSFQSSADLWIM